MRPFATPFSVSNFGHWFILISRPFSVPWPARVNGSGWKKRPVRSSIGARPDSTSNPSPFKFLSQRPNQGCCRHRTG